ncbi:MAG: hypothetical protein K8S98_06710 [Planctomycetes bacterium]|nr:hypothetical protein [Planctomycetota bacterium]
MAQDATIKPAEIAAYRAYLDSVIKPGDVIVRATWTSVTAGTFDTFAVCSGANVLYEPFLQLVPSDWPFSTPLFASTTVTCHWPASGGTWSFANGFGATACSFSIDATAHCNGSELIGCNPPDFEASGKAFTWTANASATSTAIGNCCVTNVVFGYASGFKKVKVGGSGGGVSGSVEIEGSIGCGGTFARSATACCD